MKTINMNKDDWRKKDFKRGYHWRSDIAYQCQICHVKTNDWLMGGYPGMGPRIICPGDDYKEHDEIEKFMKEIGILDCRKKRIKKWLSEGIREHGNQEMKRIDEKIDFNKQIIENIRKAFNGHDDVVGEIKSTENYYPSARFAGEKKRLSKKKL